MQTAGDLARWWDEQKRISTEWVGRGLDEFVEENPGWVSVIVATTAHTLVEAPMVIGQGFVDVLKLGEGAAQGGWGWAKDALRFVTVAAPAARGARTMLSRVVALADTNLPNCTWVAAVKALRQTGVRHFAVMDDLLKAAGLQVEAQTGGAFVAKLVPILRQIGARIKMLPNPSTWDDVASAAKANRDGVVMFSVKYPGGAHTLLAQYHLLKGVLIADRTGKIVSGFGDLAKLYGPAFAQAVPYGDMAFVQSARIVQALQTAGILGLLGLETVAVLTPPGGAKPNPPVAPPPRRAVVTGGGAGFTVETRYTVQPGDSLSKIAKEFYGELKLWPHIYNANRAVVGPNPNLIHPGQTLKIPELR